MIKFLILCFLPRVARLHTYAQKADNSSRPLVFTSPTFLDAYQIHGSTFILPKNVSSGYICYPAHSEINIKLCYKYFLKWETIRKQYL
jgi:hypothetical protein